MKRVVALLVLALVSLTYAQFTLPYTYNVSTADSYFLSWGFNEDNTTITIQVILYHESWVGICFHNGSDSGMTNGDFIVATFENGVATVSDMVAPGEQEPTPDTEYEAIPNCQDNIISSSASQVTNGDGSIITMMTFQRLLNTGDACDCHIVNDTMNFAYAFGNNSDSFSYHGNNRGVFSLNLFQYGDSNYVPPPPQNFSLQGLHGTLMLFAFAFMMTLGTFLPRYMKEFWWWFPLHIILQVIAVVTALIGFGIAVYMVGSGNQFSTLHSYFGAATLLLAFVSPFIGTAAHFTWKPSRERIPIIPDVLHWWVARIALVLSYCTILLGMNLLGVPKEFYLGFILVLLTYAFVFSYLDIIKIKQVGPKRFFSLQSDLVSTNGDYEVFK